MTDRTASVRVECVQGNIAAQPDMDAIVNAANGELMPGSGVAGAIHGAAGPELAEECRPLAPIQPGQAVITGAHKLPNRHVIHCLGPVYGVDEPSDRLLAECIHNALRLADHHGLASIAFPAISTGVFGYPLEQAAEVVMEAVADTLDELRTVRTIRFVLFSDDDLAVFESARKDQSRLSGD